MLVGVFRVVLLGHVVTEQKVGDRLEAVRVATGDVDADGVLVADVLAERLAALEIEDDDPSRPLHADEKIILAAFVVMKAPDHALPRERDVRLPHRPLEPARPVDLDEPAALVLEPPERDPAHAFHQRFAPCWRTKSFTS